MILPEDDFPLHQAPVPLIQVMGGHPNAYDRFFFNGFTEEWFFAVALGLYPNRGVIDAAISIARPGHQRSVFASDRLYGRRTSVGPIRVEILEPMVRNRIIVDAADLGISADITYHRDTATIEEARQTMIDEGRTFLDCTRATQLGTWEGRLESAEGVIDVTGTRATKDRSWGVRPVGEPLPGAPSATLPQICFQWAQLHLADRNAHYMSFDDAVGHPIVRSAHWSDASSVSDAVGTISTTMHHATRRPASASLTLDDAELDLSPVLTFFMRGVGYAHPRFGHGRWHGGPVVDTEILATDELDELEFANIHTEQVVRVTGASDGLGVLESLVIGPASHLGLGGILDGA